MIPVGTKFTMRGDESGYVYVVIKTTPDRFYSVQDGVDRPGFWANNRFFETTCEQINS